jgi:hypothetical protein
MNIPNKKIDKFIWLRFFARLFSADYRTMNCNNNKYDIITNIKREKK